MRPVARSTPVRPILSAFGLVLAIVVAFYFGVAALKGTLADAFATESAIGEANRFVDLAIRRQLDEENALRGYVGSGRRIFLEPYERSSSEFAGTFDTLERALVRADLGDERPFVAQARATNEIWQRLVARPLLTNRHRSDVQFLEVRGKTLVDRYRAEIGHVDRAIAVRSALETTAAALAVSRVGILGVLAIVFVAIVLALSLRAQSRLGRELVVERRLAAAMQRGFLQSSLPTAREIGFDASYVPAGREALVGGDWYDILVLPGGRVMFSIGDVAGHGIDAAIAMSRAREAIVALGYDATDPALVLERANEVLLLQRAQMATAIFGYVDVPTRTVTYASAGHPPPVVWAPGGGARLLEPAGLPLGILADQNYENVRYVAPHRSVVVLYTDGFTERMRDPLAGEDAMLVAVDDAARSGLAQFASRVHALIFGETVPGDDAAIVSIAFLSTSDATSNTSNEPPRNGALGAEVGRVAVPGSTSAS